MSGIWPSELALPISRDSLGERYLLAGLSYLGYLNQGAEVVYQLYNYVQRGLCCFDTFAYVEANWK